MEFLELEAVGIFGHIVGFLGMIFIVSAYLSIEKGWLHLTNFRYYLINLTGAILLTISLIIHFNLGGFLIEMFWIWISVSGLIKIHRSKKNK